MAGAGPGRRSLNHTTDVESEVPDMGEWNDRQQAQAAKKLKSCPDCGERGERKGHMGCQYPQD